ncbi:YkvS family protein [Cytobacillus firmus]|uniref:YkvS family protein n=1 Tax=Cytobacillus firmus TaxID=1399 RepID=UPI002162D23A|nr:YkvS family protein [Cytobacillus firmus]MCS0671775.1 YkvS family protein [Cytobacillus firmus]
MSEETEKVSKGKKADVGDTISILSGSEKGKKGRVIVVRDNSVIVELGIDPKKDEPIKTVISHKRYKVVK